ncbi:MAG: acyl-CoA dehydrogenase family protein [Actinobacteria bacterium]|nr:acyl-CoA dehydrogenase family protein [Actinomycetota bacterium]MBU4241451.1 acyl-CoA dehydrogenase family protein [Actinomycetota bacterium]MBU4301449.1 acyl-CoA dehydrogenase family protein [Actinomycetota bacterium]MBU4489115.1 acyl-CoA dehydrogenase family protein [Actinomycetota bacterium]MCG2796244.1 acyl-CoA dehydrogenase family protein [Actinomycetes bacterium]
MAYELSEEQEALRAQIQQMAVEKVAPRAAEIDREGDFPWDMQKLLAENELLGLSIPEEYGGSGASLLSNCIVAEELARACATTSLIFVVQKLAAYPIVLAGSEEIKQKYLPPLARGEVLAAFCLTERGAGSDAAATKTTAVETDDGYLLNGEKCFITNGSIADTFSTFTMTDIDRGVRGISAFVVEKEFPGFSVGPVEDKMGLRGAQVSEVKFEDCLVPKENMLGERGSGFITAMKTLDSSRPLVGAQAVGIAQGALDVAVGWAREREQFGSSIGKLQGIQFMLADMKTRVEAARQLVYRSATLCDNNDPELSLFSAMSKLFASDMAMSVTADAVQVLGGYGYMKDQPLERMMRDAKVTQIYEGTNQVQRVVVARRLLGKL